MSDWSAVPVTARPIGWNFPLPPELQHPADGADRCCWVCGVAPAKTDRDDDWAPLRPLHPAGPRDRDGDLLDQPWRRRHQDCLPTAEAIVSRMLGREVEEAVAVDVAEAFGQPLTARGANATSKAPHGWIARADRDRLTALVAMSEEATGALASVDGRCAMCGIGRSETWHRVRGLQWPDGRPASVCGACEPLVPLPDGEVVDLDALRIAALADLAGLRVSPELSAFRFFGFRLAIEAVGLDERDAADAGRWDYRPEALEAVVFVVQRLRPELIRDPGLRASLQRSLANDRAREQEALYADVPGVQAGW